MVKDMVKSTIMLVGYLEVPRTPVSWPIKVRRLAPMLRTGCLYSPVSPRTVVVRPSPTDGAPQHLCRGKGYDNEPSRDILLERGYIAHIRSIGEEKDGAGQRRCPARRWVVERTLGWLSKCRAILVRYEKKAAIASSIGLTSKALPILCSACPVLATWGIGPWVSRCLTLVGHTIAPGKEELATHYPRCLHGI